MDYESILRLGLNPNVIDFEASDERYDPSTNNHIIKIVLKKELTESCPHCGGVDTFKLRSSISQILKHSSSLESNIFLELKRRIYKCDCGKTFREMNPFSKERQRITKAKTYKILESARNINKSFKEISLEYNVSLSTVLNKFDEHIHFPRLKLTEVLCVDEVYSKHIAYKSYCFITYSPQLDKILDVLPSRNKEYILGYFGNIPLEERKIVKYFSMDLYEVYRQVAHLCFPNAKVCADHFHVVKNLTTFFNTARIKIMKKYEHLKNQNDNWYWLYKKYWKLLLKNPEKLGYTKIKTTRTGLYLDEHQIVNYMLSIDAELNNAYELMNEYKSFNSTAKASDAAERLDELIIKFHNSSLDEYYKFYKLLKKWRIEIINSFDRLNGYIISNGGMERANRDIKTLIRHAYGYRNFNRVRNRIMLVKNTKNNK